MQSFLWNYFNQVVLFFVILCFSLLLFFLLFQYRQIKTLRRSRSEMELEEHRIFDFLHELGKAFSEDIRSSDLHRLIVEGAINILHATGGSLYLVDSEEKSLVPAFLSEDLPPLIVIPEFVRRATFTPSSIYSNNSLSSSSIRSFFRLQSILPKQGLIGKAWFWDRPQLLNYEQLDASLVKTGLSSVLLGPLIYRNKTIGVLALGNKEKKTFSSGGIHLFQTITEQAAFALHSHSIYKAANEKKLLDRDVEVAQNIQKLLLPASSPSLEGYQISGINIPAKSLSGDYFDYVTIDDHHLGIAIGDVSGKGIPAALIMAMCRSSLRSQASNCYSPTAVLKQVNRQLYPDIKEDMFISMAYILINNITNEALLSRAGHDAPLFYSASDRSVAFLKPKGMVVGIDTGEVFDRVCSDFSFHFEQGDCLLLYTDGVTEALNGDGHSFGIERLVQYLKENAMESSSSLLKRLTDYIRTFVARQPQHDDITLIAIRKL